ncbi:hypothetical protein [Mycolicibacterium vanbaalenii]|uniref:hypothetical protein n=1 Tax=Mycolicibacterium vanbaalenii TaxID=110539 RepID=UPI0021F2545D|nr:hypothetical protein [Mycolicibacterium vanbaalenii]
MIHSKVRVALAAVAGAAVLPFAVGCSSGSAAAEQPSGNHDAFVQCMTEHGVSAPPGGGHSGPPPEGAPGRRPRVQAGRLVPRPTVQAGRPGPRPTALRHLLRSASISRRGTPRRRPVGR